MRHKYHITNTNKKRACAPQRNELPTKFIQKCVLKKQSRETSPYQNLAPLNLLRRLQNLMRRAQGAFAHIAKHLSKL